MKLKSLYLLLLIATTACQQNNFETEKLNGYWEIEKVVLASGEKKEYNINTIVDFIEIKDNQGKRSKVAPKLNGTFQTNKDADDFTIIKEDNKTIIRFKTPYNEWDETLLELTENNFVIENQNNNTYYYKRFEPFSFE